MKLINMLIMKQKLAYFRKLINLFGSSMVGYWPLWEPSGASAIDIENGLNGAYSNVTLAQTGIGDGNTSTQFNGTTSYLNLLTNGLMNNSANELVLNNGFETAGAGGADVWTVWSETAGDGAIADTTTAGEFHGGAHAAKLTAGATPASSPRIAQTSIVVVPGVTYTFSFWTRGDGTYAGRYSVYDATHSSNIKSTTSTGITDTNYAQVSYSFAAPAGCLLVTLYLYCPSTTGGIAYFDDVSLKSTIGNGLNGSEGTIVLCAKINAAEWIDGAQHNLFNMASSDGASFIRAYKKTTDNTIECDYGAGGTTKTINISTSTTAWFHLALTWSKAGNAFKVFFNGTQSGTTQTGLGNWYGELYATTTTIGSKNTTPQMVHSGYLAHVVIGNIALTDAQIAKAAVLPL